LRAGARDRSFAEKAGNAGIGQEPLLMPKTSKWGAERIERRNGTRLIQVIAARQQGIIL
jgi:hypothetical protein